MKFVKWVFFCSIHCSSLFPVDISYLVCDCKYSKEHGIKICELQHGSLSALQGDIAIHGGDGKISPMIADFFDQFAVKKCATGSIYPPVKRSLAERGWNVEQRLSELLHDAAFLEVAELAPVDPSSIASYKAMVYADFDIARNCASYTKAFPGILFLNEAILPYWRDKYKMNVLFDTCEELKTYKAEWRLYPKKYDTELSRAIKDEMPAELYVIKPRSEVLANGVIVVASDDLDNVLQMITKPKKNLKTHPDKKYSYWWNNDDESFLIEKYYSSDFLTSPESGYHYDATIRIAFILKYDKEMISYHSLGGFWKLPLKALEEEGTLNEKRISCCKLPFYSSIDPELFKEVDTKLEKAMLLLYKSILLDFSKDLT